MNKHGLISIVIITKDTRELLKGLLKSIEKDIPLQPFIGKIIVVDNASADGTEEMIRTEFSALVYARNEQNMGFAFSANRGSSLAEDEYILFLNSDTVLIEGELEKMVRFMDSDASVGICGPQLVYPDMKPQRSSAAIPSLWGDFLPQRGVRVQGSGVRGQNASIHDSGSDSMLSALRSMRHATTDPRSPIPVFKDVPSLIGAAILVRREALKAIGGFDERFFFFLEETDLCVRVWQAGHRVVFFPEAQIIHLQGKTVRKNWISGRMEYNISLSKFIKKHHTPTYYGVFVAVRFTKVLFLVAIFPFLFFGQRMRMKYAYYVKLVSWYLSGCPDNAGLRPAKNA